MKRLGLAVIMFLLLGSNAMALQWTLEASSNVPYVLSDFSILFDNANGDNVLSDDEIIWFSGVEDVMAGKLFDILSKMPDGATIGSFTIFDPRTPSSYALDMWNFQSSITPGYTFGGGFEMWNYELTSTPIPGAIWLLGSGLVGLAGFRKRFMS